MNIPWNVLSAIMGLVGTLFGITASVLLALGLYVLNDIRSDINTQAQQRQDDKAEINARIDRAMARVEQQLAASVGQSDGRQRQSLDQVSSELATVKQDISQRLDRQQQTQESTLQLIYVQNDDWLQRIVRIEETIKRWEPLVVRERVE